MKILSIATPLTLLLCCNAFAQPMNILSEAEKADGWQLLFDGKTVTGLHTYGKTGSDAVWDVQNGLLHCKGNGDFMQGQEDLVADGAYGEFDLRLEWKIVPGGHSGVVFHVQENPGVAAFQTGPMIMLADDLAGTGERFNMPHSADLVGLIPAAGSTSKPAGEWNWLEIYCKGNYLNIRQNGSSVISTPYGDQSWRKLIAQSGYKKFSGFGTYDVGQIVLQNGGGEVWFRNIRIRSLAGNARAQTAKQSNGYYVHSAPPTGVFDQRHLPDTAIDDWWNGIQFAADGRLEEAMAAFERSASLGDADAALEIGCFVDNSMFFREDSAMAYKWYKFAATNGNLLAAHRISGMVFNGQTPLPKDSWYGLDTSAANRGSMSAATELMVCYRPGRPPSPGLPLIPNKEVFWQTKIVAMKALAYALVNTDANKAAMAAMFDDIVGRIENAFVLADPTLAADRTPSHTIKSIVITKFEGHLKGGQIDRNQPYEIECSVVPDPWFMAWNFRVNNLIIGGKPRQIISRMSWGQHLQFTQYLPLAQQVMGSDYWVGIHELQQ